MSKVYDKAKKSKKKTNRSKDIWKDHNAGPIRTSYGGNFFKSQMEQREQRKSWMFSKRDISRATKK